MKISIIIPTCNEAVNIGRLVNYLLENGENFIHEIIVVDCFSKDDTAKIAEYAGAKVVFCEKKSRVTQLNIGAWFAKGEILYFVHADVVPPKTFAAEIINAVKEGFTIGNYCSKFMSEISFLRINERCTHYNFLFARGGGDQTLFVTRETFKALDGYDERFAIMEDYDFVKRARKNFPFKIMHNEVLVSARKYTHNGYFRVSLANAIVYALYKAGVSSEFLRTLYKKLLNSKKTASTNHIETVKNAQAKVGVEYV